MKKSVMALFLLCALITIGCSDDDDNYTLYPSSIKGMKFRNYTEGVTQGDDTTKLATSICWEFYSNDTALCTDTFWVLATGEIHSVLEPIKEHYRYVSSPENGHNVFFKDHPYNPYGDIAMGGETFVLYGEGGNEEFSPVMTFKRMP